MIGHYNPYQHQYMVLHAIFFMMISILFVTLSNSIQWKIITSIINFFM